jgi:hypothetical protein
MGVTEFALLRLRKDGHDDPDLLETLCQTNEIQDQWIDQHQPHLREQDDNQSQFYLQEADSEPYLLITAPWDSPEGHKEWIQSKENQEAMVSLIGPFLVAGDMDLFHMEPAVRDQKMSLKNVTTSASFNVARLSIHPGSRQAVQTEFQRLEDDLVKTYTKRQIWAGWRIEGAEKLETLVVFWNPAAQSEEIHYFLRKYGQHETRTFRSIGHGACGVYRL